MRQDEVVRTLATAGCVAPEEEAAELFTAAGDDEELLGRMVDRRVRGEPLEWIVGSISFCGVTVRISPGVYVPRWQTEQLVRRGAELAPADGVVVDVCTGSGAVAVALRSIRPDVRVVATECDPAAAECARSNGVEVFVGDLDSPLPPAFAGTVDLITAVVPYVPTDAIRLLPRDVQDYEPRLALDGGVGGVEILERVVARAPRWLRPGGWLLLELGGDQAEPVTARMRAAGFVEIRVVHDAEGDARGIEGMLPD